MAITEFKDINWSGDEPLDTAKLQAMVSNTRYLFERMPKLYYNAYGGKRDVGIKIAAGHTYYTAYAAAGRWVPVYFGSFFTVGCRPVITLTVHTATNYGMSSRVMSIDWTSAIPDHRGFQAGIYTAGPRLTDQIKPGWVGWHAIGY